MKFNVCVAIEGEGKLASEVILAAEKMLETFNYPSPKALLDSFELIDYALPEEYEAKIFGGERMMVNAFITPDGEWVSSPSVMMAEPESVPVKIWEAELKILLEKHAQCDMVIASCHS